MSLLSWLPAVGNVVGSIAGSVSNSNNVKSTNKTNIQLQQMQQQANIDMWNANNAYNTPSAQMQRDVDAGVNPWLDGNLSSGNSSGPAQSVPPAQVQPSNPGNAVLSAVNNLLNTQMMQAQVSQAKSAAVSAAAKAKLDASQAHNIDVMTPKQGRNIDADTALKQGQDLLNLQSTFNLKQESDFRHFTNTLYQAYGNQLSKLQVDKLAADIRDVDKDVALKVSQAHLNDEEAKTEYSKRLANVATAYNLRTNANVNAALMPSERSANQSRSDYLHWSARSGQKDYQNYWINKGLQFGGSLMNSAGNAIGHLIPW